MSDSMRGQLKSAGRTMVNFFLVIMGVLIILYVLSGIYTVENNEKGVLLRFGKIVDAHVSPGFHFAFPWPIDRVYKVPFPKVESVDIKDFSQRFSFGEGGLSFTALTGLGTYAITGDNNLVNFECVLQYEVRDSEAYLFNLGESVEKAAETAKRFLIEMACNTIIHCLAQISVGDVLTDWERIVIHVKKNLQDRLNEIECGLAVTFVEIKILKPPMQVQEYFDDVINAKIDKNRAIDNAESYKNQELPAARGRAGRLRADAEGYYTETVQNAEGEAQRFLELLSEYRNDKETTRYRLYTDALQEVLVSVGRLDLIETMGDEPPVKIKLIK